VNKSRLCNNIHLSLSEREFVTTITLIGIPWGDQYQDGINSTAVNSLIRGPLQAYNSGVRGMTIKLCGIMRVKLVDVRKNLTPKG